MSEVEFANKLGVVSFRQTVVDILPFQSSVQEQMSNKLYWHLYSQKYTTQKWSAIMSHIQQIDVEQMQLSDNDHEHIVKEIVPVSFPSLISLSLISNKIKSIEPFCASQMPNLLYLHLCRNEIRTLAPLRKVYWPRLLGIIMNDNPLTDCSSVISQCYFPDLQLIILQGWLDSLVFAQDLSFFFKIQSAKLKYLNIQSQLRVKSTKICEHLRQRYRQLRVNAQQ